MQSCPVAAPTSADFQELAGACSVAYAFLGSHVPTWAPPDACPSAADWEQSYHALAAVPGKACLAATLVRDSTNAYAAMFDARLAANPMLIPAFVSCMTKIDNGNNVAEDPACTQVLPLLQPIIQVQQEGA